MRARSFLHPLAILLTVTPILVGQEREEVPEAGFLNIVNLIGLKSPTFIQLDRFSLNGGEAMTPGETSGVLAIRPATYPFSLSNTGANPETVTGDFVMESGKTVAIVCYDEVTTYRDGSEEVKLRYTVLEESDIVGPMLSLISLLQQPSVVIDVSGTPVTLLARRAFQKEVALDDKVHILSQGRTLARFDVAKPVHYLGFLYEEAGSGEWELSLIENEKLEYQPPLETEAAGEVE